MPGQLDESRAIFRWLATEISPDTHINVMGQYRPAHRVGEPDRQGGTRYASIDRPPRGDELSLAIDAARDAGLWRLDSPPSRWA
jgi:putative pyruvate formate lyase activating enzyme